MRIAHAGNPHAIAQGEERLKHGELGAILLAGGMGTRLGFPHPKGMFPIFPNVTLFEIFAKKTLEASKRAKRPLNLAIMTSRENDRETQAFFQHNQRFGLAEEQLVFFQQGLLPMQNDQGEDLPVLAPDGNGLVFKHFVQSGLYALWQAKGIEYLNIVLVDNPLADPFDANLLGFHVEQQADVTVKCIARDNPEEKVGLIIRSEGQVRVQEYSEISDEEKKGRLPNGQLKHPLANISLFCLSMPFVAKLATQTFPIHKAQKPLELAPSSPLAWKQEYFIFDLLPFAQKPALLVYPRAQVFAPLKNKEGADSPESVRALLKSTHLYK